MCKMRTAVTPSEMKGEVGSEGERILGFPNPTIKLLSLPVLSVRVLGLPRVNNWLLDAAK